MFKKIFALICLGLSCVCFGDGFNEEALENPPENIKIINNKNNERILYSNKFGTTGKAIEYNLEYYVSSRIFINQTNRIPQIVFVNYKGFPSSLFLQLSDGKNIELKISEKKTFPSELETAYRIISDLTVEQYVNYFIKNHPVKIKVLIPEVKNHILVLPLHEEWLKAFEDMKVFFKVDEK